MAHTDMSFGSSHDAMPKAFTVGPMFPKKNTKAAKDVVKAVREKQKKRIERMTLQKDLTKAKSFKEAVKIVKNKKK